jgi:hypothetical protein
VVIVIGGMLSLYRRYCIVHVTKSRRMSPMGLRIWLTLLGCTWMVNVLSMMKTERKCQQNAYDGSPRQQRAT